MIPRDHFIEFDGHLYERIRYGAESWWKPGHWYSRRVKDALQPSCLVCSTGIGYLHQLDCTLEECPVHPGRRLADHDHDESERGEHSD